MSLQNLAQAACLKSMLHHLLLAQLTALSAALARAYTVGAAKDEKKLLA